MEVWSLINKSTKELIKFDVVELDDDIGVKYFFTDNEYSAIWVVNSEETVKNAHQRFIHPINSINYKNPSTEYINIDDYDIVKLNY